jgi:hypothetical protein
VLHDKLHSQPLRCFLTLILVIIAF